MFLCFFFIDIIQLWEYPKDAGASAENGCTLQKHQGTLLTQCFDSHNIFWINMCQPQLWFNKDRNICISRNTIFENKILLTLHIPRGLTAKVTLFLNQGNWWIPAFTVSSGHVFSSYHTKYSQGKCHFIWYSHWHTDKQFFLFLSKISS